MSYSSLSELPETELQSLCQNTAVARVLTDAMRLEGARALGGDVIMALARAGLRLVSIDSADPAGASTAAEARMSKITETRECACGLSVWARLTNVTGPGAGWWHRDEEDGYTTRKCPEGNRKPS